MTVRDSHGPSLKLLCKPCELGGRRTPALQGDEDARDLLQRRAALGKHLHQQSGLLSAQNVPGHESGKGLRQRHGPSLTGLETGAGYDPGMLAEFGPILVLLLIAGFLCAAMVTLSYVLGPKKVTSYKASPYECGVAPLGNAIERFPIKFYLVAILFVLFDIEVVFLWSWLTVFKSAPLEFQIFSAIDVAVYLGLWIVGYLYVMKIGALDWDEATSLAPEKLESSSGEAAA